MRANVGDYRIETPHTLDEALAMLAENPGWKPIAGGTDLMVLFNAGRLEHRHLVNLGNLKELRRWSCNRWQLWTGALTTFAELRQREWFPLLTKAASWIGGVANQNRATIGGNIANASPAADSAPALLVYDAQIALISRRGSRLIPYHTFHTGYKTTLLEPEELVGHVVFSARQTWDRHYLRKVGTRRAQAITKVGLAGLLNLDDDRIADIRIAVSSVAPYPLRCFATENALRGQKLNRDTLALAQQTLSSEISPIDDIRSTAAYRRQVALNLLAEFLDV